MSPITAIVEAINIIGDTMKNMIESVSSQLPPSKLSANEIMQRVQAMLEPLILTHYNERNANEDKVLADFVQLKRDVWGSSDG